MSFNPKPDHSDQPTPEGTEELDQAPDLASVHASFGPHAIEENVGKIAGKPPIGL